MPAPLPCLSVVLELARAQEAADPYAFRTGAQEYLLRQEGGGITTARLEWDQALLSDLAAARLPGRDPAVLQRLGELLRRFLLPLGWGEYEAQIQAALDQQRRVHLSLRFAAAELYALPWELLTFRTTGQHIGELAGVLVRYEWPGTTTVAERAPAAPRVQDGQILFAWSAAAGAVPAAEHQRAIAEACQACSLRFDIDQDVLPHVSCPRLSSALQSAERAGRPVRVLHLLCHGAGVGTTFGLALDEHEAEGSLVLVDAGRLRQLLSPFAATLRLVVLCACDSGNSGALGNQLGSVAQALHRVGIAAVVASRFPLSVNGSIRLAETLYQELLGQPLALEGALLLARRRLAEQAAELDWASLQLYARAADGDDSRPVIFRPFRGLLTFQAEHRRFFFGREREIAEVVSDLDALATAARPRFLIVAGASGSGKSSLVLAGAAPQLAARPQSPLRTACLRPGAQAELEALVSTLQQDPAPTLLIVDQFEELFTHIAEPAPRQQWVRRLWQLASDAHSGIWVILTLRVDFIGRCGEILLADNGQRLDSVAYDEAHRVFVAQLGPEQLTTVITEPAHKVGLQLEEGLAQRLLRDVGAEPGALPALEYTLDLLWERRQGRLLTQASYDEVGGVAGALHGRAEALLGSMTSQEQLMARRLLVRLCSIGDDPTQSTRRRVAIAELRPAGAAAERFFAVLSVLVNARLLVCDGEGESKTAEIAHEALIRKWPRLVDWVRADRQMLLELQKLEQWATERRVHGTLLTGDQLVYAEGIAAHYQDECSSDAHKLITESQAARQQQKRLRQGVIAALVVATIVSSAFAWYGFQNSREARAAEKAEADQRKQATEERSKAQSAEKEERAAKQEAQRKLLDSYVERGRIYLVERKDAVRALLWLNRAYQEGHDTTALRLLLSQAYFSLGVTRPAVAGEDPVFSPDSRLLTTRSKDQIMLWEVHSSKHLQTFPGSAASFSADGTRLVVCHDKGASAAIIDIKDLKSAAAPLTLSAPGVTIAHATFSPDGSRLAGMSVDGLSITLWDAHSGALLRTLPAPPTPKKDGSADLTSGRGVHFSRDGRRVLSDGSGPTGAWDARSGRLLWDTRKSKNEGITTVSYSFASDQVGIGWYSMQECAGATEVWDGKTGKLLTKISACSNLQFVSPDGRHLLTQTVGPGLVLYDWKQSMQRSIPSGYDTQSVTLFSPNGAKILSADEDALLVLWDTATVQPAQTIAADGTPVAFSPNGELLAMRNWQPDTIQLIDVGLVDTMPGLVGARRAADAKSPVTRKSWVTPDGLRELDQADSGVVFIRDARTHKPLQRLEVLVSGPQCRSFTRDGAYAVTWTIEEDDSIDYEKRVVNRARIWDVATGALLLEQRGQTAALIVESLHPEGSQVRGRDGKPWELSPVLPSRAALDKFLRCRVPLRLEGEALVQVNVKANCEGAIKP